jgi:hypothetical protein
MSNIYPWHPNMTPEANGPNGHKDPYKSGAANALRGAYVDLVGGKSNKQKVERVFRQSESD